MGYYSTFDVYTENTSVEKHREIIKDFIDSNKNASWCLDDDGTCMDTTKWHGFEGDMKELSKKYPEVVFTCYRNGDESEDFEKYRVVNGESKSGMGSIVYPEF